MKNLFGYRKIKMTNLLYSQWQIVVVRLAGDIVKKVAVLRKIVSEGEETCKKVKYLNLNKFLKEN